MLKNRKNQKYNSLQFSYNAKQCLSDKNVNENEIKNDKLDNKLNDSFSSIDQSDSIESDHIQTNMPPFQFFNELQIPQDQQIDLIEVELQEIDIYINTFKSLRDQDHVVFVNSKDKQSFQTNNQEIDGKNMVNSIFQEEQKQIKTKNIWLNVSVQKSKKFQDIELCDDQMSISATSNNYQKKFSGQCQQPQNRIFNRRMNKLRYQNKNIELQEQITEDKSENQVTIPRQDLENQNSIFCFDQDSMTLFKFNLNNQNKQPHRNSSSEFSQYSDANSIKNDKVYQKILRKCISSLTSEDNQSRGNKQYLSGVISFSQKSNNNQEQNYHLNVQTVQRTKILTKNRFQMFQNQQVFHDDQINQNQEIFQEIYQIILKRFDLLHSLINCRLSIQKRKEKQGLSDLKARDVNEDKQLCFSQSLLSFNQYKNVLDQVQNKFKSQELDIFINQNFQIDISEHYQQRENRKIEIQKLQLSKQQKQNNLESNSQKRSQVILLSIASFLRPQQLLNKFEQTQFNQSLKSNKKEESDYFFLKKTISQSQELKEQLN